MTIQYSENLIPIMESNNTPSGIVRTSSEYNGRPGWIAFDGYTGMYIDSVHGYGWMANATTGWISYEFPKPVIISKYRLWGIELYATRLPSAWTFEGSNDNQNWDILDIQIGITDWGNSSFFRDFEINNRTHYLIYRLNVSKNNGDSTYMYVSELEMMKMIISTKSLIKSSNGIKILSGGVWIDTGIIGTPTKLDFETYGMTDLSIVPTEKWNELDDEFEILTLGDDSEIIQTRSQGIEVPWTEGGKVFETNIPQDIIIESFIRIEI